MLFEVVRQAAELFLPIFRRNSNQNRLVEAAAHEFHLAAFDQLPQQVEEFRVPAFDPLQKRSRIVQAQVEGGVAQEQIYKRQVGARVRLLQYFVEIADRLVCMDEQNE